VTLEVFGPEMGAQTEEQELALEGVTAELRGGGEDTIEIMIGAKPDEHITHSVVRPVEVSLEQTEEGADVALAIKSGDESTTLLRFRSAILPEMIDAVVT
jgi:hypothetical protein